MTTSDEVRGAQAALPFLINMAASVAEAPQVLVAPLPRQYWIVVTLSEARKAIEEAGVEEQSAGAVIVPCDTSQW